MTVKTQPSVQKKKKSAAPKYVAPTIGMQGFLFDVSFVLLGIRHELKVVANNRFEIAHWLAERPYYTEVVLREAGAVNVWSAFTRNRVEVTPCIQPIEAERELAEDTYTGHQHALGIIRAAIAHAKGKP